MPLELPVGQRVALIDDEDHNMLEPYRWHLAGGKGPTGRYAATHVTIYGTPYTHYMHRMIAWAMGLIETPVGTAGGRWATSIDHINGDKLDNRRANLRLLTRPEQMRNPNDPPRATNRSGYRGVSFVKSRVRFGRPWMAYVTVAGKTKNLGWYPSATDAAQARAAWDQANPIGATR